MAETVKVTVSSSAYTALSSTQSAARIELAPGQRIRLHVGASAPAANTMAYWVLEGPGYGSTHTFTSYDLRDYGLGGGDEAYAMSVTGSSTGQDITVLRGSSGATASLALLDDILAPVAPAAATATQSALVGAQYNAVQPTWTEGQQGRLSLDARGHLMTRLVKSGYPTFRAIGTAFTPYATPQDIVSIFGSATRKVILVNLFVSMHSTASALNTLYFKKRSTANSGGTPTTMTALKLDSGSAAATAVVTQYGSLPTMGTEVGNLNAIIALSAATTGAPNTAAITQAIISGGPVSPGPAAFNGGIEINGTAEGVTINWAGAALAAGFTIPIWGVEWVEIPI